MPQSLIIIPTYNEMENLPRLLTDIFGLNLDADVLVIDDGSPDGTGEWAESQAKENARVHVLRRPGKMGLGSAYVEGFKFALDRDYEFVFEMDADFSHNPAYLPDFLREIQTSDLVLGSRYVHGVTVVNWPMSRLLLSWCANRFARVVTGMPLRDATGGYKCFRASALRRLDLNRIRSDGYSFQIEVNFKLWKLGCRIREIPIVFVDRVAGVSKMSSKIIQEALFLVFRLRLGWKA